MEACHPKGQPTMSNACRTGAYIKIDPSGGHAELRIVISDQEAQGRVDADMIDAFVKIFAAAAADMKKLQRRELTPPVQPHQFFVATEND
jgi:hypothetical protein